MGIEEDQAPPHLAPKSGDRRADIQGLRAVAVLMVVLFHAGLPVPGGFVGVDVFFVISGFVIAAMLLREADSRGRVSIRRFYWRRFLRLSPALALLVVATMVLTFVLLPPFGEQQNAAQTAIGAALLVANGVIAITTGGYFGASADSNPLLNTWSLSVEEQFYLVFPSLLILGIALSRRVGRQRSVAVLVIAMASIVSFVMALLGSSYAAPERGGAPLWLLQPIHACVGVRRGCPAGDPLA
jgi:peptidoglycan/LPS O-acetylase OafA/YrhL